MKHIAISATLAIACVSCGASDSDSKLTSSAKTSAVHVDVVVDVQNDPNTSESCLTAARKLNDADSLKAELACPMAVTEKVTIKFVGTDESYGCEPRVIAVAPKESRREYVRVGIQHGSDEEFTAVVRLQNKVLKVLKDRNSGWRNYG